MADKEDWEFLKRRPSWNRRPRAEHLIVIHSWDEVPPNMTEAEEDEFWRTHALGDELFENPEPLDADEAELLARIRRRRAQQGRDRAAG
jgi:hypothetical protein